MNLSKQVKCISCGGISEYDVCPQCGANNLIIKLLGNKMKKEAKLTKQTEQPVAEQPIVISTTNITEKKFDSILALAHTVKMLAEALKSVSTTVNINGNSFHNTNDYPTITIKTAD